MSSGRPLASAAGAASGEVYERDAANDTGGEQLVEDVDPCRCPTPHTVPGASPVGACTCKTPAAPTDERSRGLMP